MKVRINRSYMMCIVAVFTVNASGAGLKAQPANNSTNVVHTVTLLAQAKHGDFKTATVNFAIGARGDSKDPPTRNDYDLRYGGRSENGDMDWFEVPMGDNSRSQIKDLGESGWSDIYDVPILLASPTPHNSGMTEVYQAGKVVQRSPEGVLAKAMLGHLYLLHSKHDRVDLYVLFRVEEMKPSDECTISWKLIPSPESK
jgi:hypothetical protein